MARSFAEELLRRPIRYEQVRKKLTRRCSGRVEWILSNGRLAETLNTAAGTSFAFAGNSQVMIKGENTSLRTYNVEISFKKFLTYCLRIVRPRFIAEFENWRINFHETLPRSWTAATIPIAFRRDEFLANSVDILCVFLC